MASAVASFSVKFRTCKASDLEMVFRNKLLALAAANGDLVEISDDYYMHSDVEQQSKETLAEKLAEGTGMTMSEIRETLQTSRKYAVPFCEYLDRIGFTQRQGDVRVLAPA